MLFKSSFIEIVLLLTSTQLIIAQLDQETLEVWIEEEWLVPGETAREPEFSEADLARAKLIRELKHDMGVNDEG